MKAQSGKMALLLILLLVLFFVAFVLTPFALAPLGVFTGLAHGVRGITFDACLGLQGRRAARDERPPLVAARVLREPDRAVDLPDRASGSSGLLWTGCDGALSPAGIPEHKPARGRADVSVQLPFLQEACREGFYLLPALRHGAPAGLQELREVRGGRLEGLPLLRRPD